MWPFTSREHRDRRGTPATSRVPRSCGACLLSARSEPRPCNRASDRCDPMSQIEARPGSPFPQGADWDGDGTNFSLFSENAKRVELCLFDDEGVEQRVAVTDCTANQWHVYLPGVGPGQRYGYRRACRLNGPPTPPPRGWGKPPAITHRSPNPCANSSKPASTPSDPAPRGAGTLRCQAISLLRKGPHPLQELGSARGSAPRVLFAAGHTARLAGRCLCRWPSC